MIGQIVVLAVVVVGVVFLGLRSLIRQVRRKHCGGSEQDNKTGCPGCSPCESRASCPLDNGRGAC